MLSRRYAGSAVIGADLCSQPRRNATWGNGSCIYDWNKAAERTGSAIHNANIDWLIFVEGIQWGSDLSHVLNQPVNLAVKNKLVYSVQCFSIGYDNKTSLENLRDHWNAFFGFVINQQIAPIYISEFGTPLKSQSDELWLNFWLSYSNGQYLFDGVSEIPPGHERLSWACWPLSPYGVNGGILKEDWLTVEFTKISLIGSSLAPLIEDVDQSIQFNANISAIVPMPTMKPTSFPSRPLFDYFHTSGNQIVDKHGNSIRISGINWFVVSMKNILCLQLFIL
jgi:endoglucanase